MDPLSAISLAGSILQFVEFGTSLFFDSRKLYQSTSGSFTDHEELELVTSNIHCFIAKLQNSSQVTHDFGPLTAKDQDERDRFQQICDGAKEVAEELLGRLVKLKVQNNSNHRVRESFQKAFMSAWSKAERASLVKRLDSFKEILKGQLLFSIKSKIDIEAVKISSRFDSLDQQTQNIISLFIENKSTREVRSQIEALALLVQRLDSKNDEQHRQTRDIILQYQQQRQSLQQRAQQLKDVDKQESLLASNYLIGITASFEVLSVADEQERGLRRAVYEIILKSLQYPSMYTRYENIVEAYPDTFEWAFRDPTVEQSHWSNLSRWLKSGDGIYWVNGKAGSGKSTLMKHIYDSERTHQYLSKWAQTIPAKGYNKTSSCLATFFFWNSGTREQKSQVGLLRALLHQVLTHDSDLTPILFPELWAKVYAQLANDLTKGGFLLDTLLQAWPLEPLIAAFRALAHQQSVSFMSCFLVDGLDEFEGDHEELADLFLELTISKSLKVCVSSRPWIVFKEKFQGCQSLRLQDLTYHDIEKYVTSKFSRSPAFPRLLAQEPEAAPALIREIIDCSDGIFLWVRLVVKSILNGIINRDDIAILLQRLHSLPRELEPLYDCLFSQIDPVYMTWASRAFQLARTARETDNSITPLSLLKFHFAISGHVNHSRIEWTNDLAMIAECQDSEVHLISRCAGLLELHSRSGSNLETSFPYLNQSVGYLHRTAREYIEKDNWTKILTYTEGTRFNPSVSLMEACTKMICRWSATAELQKCGLAICAMRYASRADSDTTSQELQTSILHTLDQKMSLHLMPTWPSNAAIGAPREIAEYTFRMFATVFGLTGYVEHCLVNETTAVPQKASFLLKRLLRGSWDEYGRSLNFPPQSKMVALLLNFGANARGVFEEPFDKSLWDSIFDRLRLDTVSEDYLQIVKLILFDGAAPLIRSLQSCFEPIRDILTERYLPILPENTGKILKEARKWTQKKNPKISPIRHNVSTGYINKRRRLVKYNAALEPREGRSLLYFLAEPNIE